MQTEPNKRDKTFYAQLHSLLLAKTEVQEEKPLSGTPLGDIVSVIRVSIKNNPKSDVITLLRNSYAENEIAEWLAKIMIDDMGNMMGRTLTECIQRGLTQEEAMATLREAGEKMAEDAASTPES